MTPFYTLGGDDGFTGLLGEGRVSKADARMEALGTLDETTAALGLARAQSGSDAIRALLIQIQRDLYGLMAEVAATPENAEKFRTIDTQKVNWLEEQIEQLSLQVVVPREFILPGDTLESAAFSLARTVVRRAERRVAELSQADTLENSALLQYLNRLSSLCFILELAAVQSGGLAAPTKAKTRPAKGVQ